MANYFSIFLVAISAITGLVWLLWTLFFERKQNTLAVESNSASAQNDSSVHNSTDVELHSQEELPVLVDFCKQLFPIFFGVMVFRSFIYEPFQIPSGSMMPNLLTGDFILVEKFSYGLKDPVTRTKFVDTGEVERGDVVVFKYPLDERKDYIKRVIGLPGETITYRGKQLFIQSACNDGDTCEGSRALQKKSISVGDYQMGRYPLALFEEDLLGLTHQMLENPLSPSGSQRFVVPDGHYFVMGDNRDHSEDSRRWGFVPEQNLVGKAVFIWISFEFNRTDKDFLPTWIPTNIRFSRVGSIH